MRQQRWLLILREGGRHASAAPPGPLMIPMCRGFFQAIKQQMAEELKPENLSKYAISDSKDFEVCCAFTHLFDLVLPAVVVRCPSDSASALRRMCSVDKPPRQHPL